MWAIILFPVAGKSSIGSFAVFSFYIFPLSPLYVLSPIYKFILERGTKALLQLDQPNAMMIDPLKYWLFLPFQEIGIGFLFAARLLATIQAITGPPKRKNNLNFPTDQLLSSI